MNTACPIEAARALCSLISEKRREGELRVRLAPEVVAAAGSAGMFRLFVPREEMERLKSSGLLGFSVPSAHGGLGASCAEITEAITLFAEGNPAIGQMFLTNCLLGAAFLEELTPEALKRRPMAKSSPSSAFSQRRLGEGQRSAQGLRPAIRSLPLHDPTSFRIRSVGEYLLQDGAPTLALRY